MTFRPGGTGKTSRWHLGTAEEGTSPSPNLEPFRDETVKKFLSRTPVLDYRCRNCEALGICGGGCGYLSYIDSNDMSAYSDRDCKQSRTFLRKLVRDLYELNEKRITRGLQDRGFYAVQPEDRSRLRGEIETERGGLQFSVGHHD